MHPISSRPSGGLLPPLGAALLAAASLAGCCCPRPPARAAPADSAAAAPPPVLPVPDAVLAQSDSVTRIQFRNVNFHVAPGLVLGIRRLDGEMRSKTPGQPVIFDDKRAFVIRIASAEVTLDTASLGHLMNDHVFGYRGAPLRALSFGTKHGQLVQRGILHKVVDIPFEMTAQVSVTPAGLLRIHPTAMRICTIPGKGLMDALGIELSDLLDLRGARGVRVDHDDLLLDPDQLLPPPSISGRVVAVRVEPGRLVQIFGGGANAAIAEAAAALTPPDSAAPNYMYFRHGTLRFGKLYMVRADMQIVDLHPADPFDFSVDRYNAQLVAGYSKNQPDMGLEVFMPDLGMVDGGLEAPGARERPRGAP
ncbi:MAG TPA: hypothetical protein VFS08_13345 [Gemmatimonadaceae bacterium]|nr:hypothetical protein [Gemmatimonadaceae bacterium]